MTLSIRKQSFTCNSTIEFLYLLVFFDAREGVLSKAVFVTVYEVGTFVCHVVERWFLLLLSCT